MGYFLVYFLKSGFCLILFYLFYRLFLCRETFFRFNRIALLGMLLFSLIAPFFHFTIEQPTLIQKQAIDLEALLLMANEVEIVPSARNPYLIFFYIYLIGLVCVLFQMLLSVGRIRKIINSGRLLVIDNTSVYLVEKDIAPFSWINKVVMSEKDWLENGAEILTHEKAHIAAGHCYDLMAINTYILFQWFNPAVWLLKQELQGLHEYEADEVVLKHGIDAKKYQLLLIKKAVGSQRFTSVANSFNQSKLKNRITMMLKSKSNPWRKFKFAGVLPLAAIAIVAFARPEVSSELEKLSAVKITEFIPEVKAPEANPPITIADSTIKITGKLSRIKDIPADVVYVVDQEKKTAQEVKSINPNDIERVEVIKQTTPELMKMYDLKYKQGIVLITTLQSDAPKLKSLKKSQNDFYKEINGPLVLVDGELWEGNINDIDPNTIESISITKEKESLESDVAKYGAKATNGVIRIKLKK